MYCNAAVFNYELYFYGFIFIVSLVQRKVVTLPLACPFTSRLGLSVSWAV